MYPVHHPTLKIEQAERQADAALLRLAATGARRRWWSWRSRPDAIAGSDAAPAPMPPVPAAPAPVPAAGVAAADDDRVLVGR